MQDSSLAAGNLSWDPLRAMHEATVHNQHGGLQINSSLAGKWLFQSVAKGAACFADSGRFCRVSVFLEGSQEWMNGCVPGLAAQRDAASFLDAQHAGPVGTWNSS